MRRDPSLHFVEIGNARTERWLYALHGIYGAGRNWATIARRLSSARPEWGAVLVDLRLHGHSQGFEPPHTLAACARDVGALWRELERPTDALLGHSFGGKVALLAACSSKPAQVWVVDSTPSRRTPGGSATRILRILRQSPETFADRAAGASWLESRGLAPLVARWMATNLAPDGRGAYRWRLDLDGLAALLDDFFRTDLWEIVEAPPDGVAVEVVKATESDVLPEAECGRIEAAAAAGAPVSLHRLHGGHWIHVDDPDGVVRLLVDRLPGGSGRPG